MLICYGSTQAERRYLVGLLIGLFVWPQVKAYMCLQTDVSALATSGGSNYTVQPYAGKGLRGKADGSES